MKVEKKVPHNRFIDAWAEIIIGMEKMHKSMSLYVKHVGKKSEGEERDKVPIGYLGSVMVSHGQDFSPGSEFGSCLTRMVMRYTSYTEYTNCLCRFWTCQRSYCATSGGICWIGDWCLVGIT
jgi:hypothetical protein